MTEEVFRQDAYTRSCAARITAVDEAGVHLDRTVFYPLGGGQPGDTGELVLDDGTAVRIVDSRKGGGAGRNYARTARSGRSGPRGLRSHCPHRLGS